jgi:hypothetical protein
MNYGRYAAGPISAALADAANAGPITDTASVHPDDAAQHLRLLIASRAAARQAGVPSSDPFFADPQVGALQQMMARRKSMAAAGVPVPGPTGNGS